MPISLKFKGLKPLAEKTIEDILLHFGETKRAAIKRYREFVEKGIKKGTREDSSRWGFNQELWRRCEWPLGRKQKNGRRETQGYREVGIL